MSRPPKPGRGPNWAEGVNMGLLDSSTCPGICSNVVFAAVCRDRLDQGSCPVSTTPGLTSQSSWHLPATLQRPCALVSARLGHSQQGMLAVLNCIAIGVAYVAPFYLKPAHARNAPATIKFRMATTIATSLVAWLPVYWSLQKEGRLERPLLPLLGLQWHGIIRAVVWPAALTMSLFAGPVIQSCLSRTQTAHRHGHQLLQCLRNLVVAPITEEFCFRACMAPLFLLEGLSRTRTVLLTPVMFGVAHLHHLVELIRFQGLPAKAAVLQVLFQFSFTTVFGWYVTHIFLTTGHLASAVVVHALCNWQGFPPVAELKTHPYCFQLLLVYAAGVLLFAKQFRSWTLTGDE